MNADALNHLRQTHAAGSQLLQQSNYTPESLEIAIEVEKHRWCWKPKQPKLVLVAESHVFTTEQEAKFELDEFKIRPFLKPDAVLLSNRFVRLVYCLAYGESDLLVPQTSQISNTGTPLYWDVFGRVAFRCPQPPPDDGTNFNDRMHWKIDTLRELYRMGIWLLDGSVHSIYRREQGRLPSEIQQELHKQWWQGYGKYLLSNCESPKLWVIGKMVYDCLSELNFEGQECRGWVYQPNASVEDLNRNWPHLLEDCWELRKPSRTDQSREHYE